MFKKTAYLLLLVLIIIFGSYKYGVEKPEYPEYVYKTLYIDKEFDQEEVGYIMAAATEWSKATENRVNYNIVVMSSNTKINIDNALIINKVTSTYADVIILDYFFNLNMPKESVIKIKALGYYYESKILPSIILVADRLDDFNYKAVVMHELGHSLGLEHDNSEEAMYNSIMYPSAEGQSTDITVIDFIAYCKIHNCKKYINLHK